MVSRVIAADTGLTDDEALLLASGLTGLAQTGARHWLRSGRRVPKASRPPRRGAVLARHLGLPALHPPTGAVLGRALRPRRTSRAAARPGPADRLGCHQTRAGSSRAHPGSSRWRRWSWRSRSGCSTHPARSCSRAARAARRSPRPSPPRVKAGGLLSLTDEKGRVVVVPVDKLAYVEVGSPSAAGSASAADAGPQPRTQHGF